MKFSEFSNLFGPVGILISPSLSSFLISETGPLIDYTYALIS